MYFHRSLPLEVVNIQCDYAILQANIQRDKGGSEGTNKCIWEFRLSKKEVVFLETSAVDYFDPAC